MGRDYSLLHQFRTYYGDRPESHQWKKLAVLSGVNWPEFEANHYSSSRAEDKNAALRKEYQTKNFIF
jgi:hypothetical protein